MCYGTSAWGMITNYLFNRSNYLKNLLLDESLAARQKRLAIYQFLEFAHGQRAKSSTKGKDPKRIFLEYVRRLEIHGEERQLRQIPDWASGLDAVRLLTVHASKGLEFDSVFIPYLGKGFFPVSNRAKNCPPPDGMLDLQIAEGANVEEEECLFLWHYPVREIFSACHEQSDMVSRIKIHQTFWNLSGHLFPKAMMVHQHGGQPRR